MKKYGKKEYVSCFVAGGGFSQTYPRLMAKHHCIVGVYMIYGGG